MEKWEDQSDEKNNLEKICGQKYRKENERNLLDILLRRHNLEIEQWVERVERLNLERRDK